MNKPTILVVEDDSSVRSLITTTLKAHGYKFLTAANGEMAVMMASSHNPDIMLLDLGLPDIDGVEVIRRIREWSNLPIIVLSARSEDSDKIEALDQGADDYLTKPFSVDELLARLRVTQRRLNLQASGEVGSSVFVNGPLKIDFAAGCVWLNDEELHLTPIEYKLLCVLAHNVGKVLTHTAITQKVWGSSQENDIASLRVYMASLRKSWNRAHILCIWFRPMWGSATGCCVLKRMIRQKNSPQADSDKTKTGGIHPDAPCKNPQTIRLTGRSPSGTLCFSLFA